MAFSAAWFQAQERLRQKRKRDMHIPMGPNNMSGFIDIKCSWMLFEHREFDVAIK